MRTVGPRSAAASPRATLGWLLAALVLVTGAAGAGVTSSAHADEVEAAGACDGVWVVVDARKVGGSITTRCAPGNPSSGLAALEAAGHTYEFVPRVAGMVCTIDRRPDPCNGAPADAYWSYWYAEEGGSWTYASRGAGSRDPQPGDVEGWAFGAGDPPGTSPPAPAPDDGGSSEGSSSGSGSSGSSGDGSSGSGSSGSGSSGSGSSGSGSSGAGSSAGASGDGSSDGGDSQPSDATTGGSSDATTDGTADDTDAPDTASEQPAADPDDEPDPDGDDTTTEDGTDDDAEVEDDADGEDDRPEVDGSRGNEGPAGERGDVVSLPAPDEGSSGWAGLALGAGLAGALAAGAAWQVRRRRLGA